MVRKVGNTLLNVVVCSLVDIFIFTTGLSDNDIAFAGRESHLGANVWEEL